MKDGIKITGIWKFKIFNEKTGKSRFFEKKNLIPTVGKQAFASQMVGDNTTDIGDNPYIALGDDSTSPALGDTILGNETQRKVPTTSSFSGGVATFSVFFAKGEATGNHKEFGLFGDGNTSTATASANTGILYSHIATNISVGSNENLTIEYSITFS